MEECTRSPCLAVIDTAVSATRRFETGQLIKQAAGSHLRTLGDVLLGTTAAGKRPGPVRLLPADGGRRRHCHAIGEIPGRSSPRSPLDRGVSTCRLIDRPLRRTFQEGRLLSGVQVIISVFALNPDH